MSLYGIAIGTWKLPRCVEVNIRLCLEANPGTPIFLGGDLAFGSPGKEMLRMAEQFWNLDYNLNDRRLGHFPGDLSVFYHALEWAQENGLLYFAKLSQRFWILERGWLPKICIRMAQEGSALAGRADAFRDRQAFPWRSEACVLHVPTFLELRHWFDPETMAPHEYVEDRFARMIKQEKLKVTEWDLVTKDKREKRDNVLWKDANDVDEYHQQARRYFIALDPCFGVYKWCDRPGFRQGAGVK